MGTDVTEDRVLLVDRLKRRIGREVAVGDAPIVIVLEAGAVWTASTGDGTVSRIDPRTGKVVATIPVGPNPLTVATGEDGIWVGGLPG